jgi:hypothetical protein
MNPCSTPPALLLLLGETGDTTSRRGVLPVEERGVVEIGVTMRDELGAEAPFD